jgi:hypothetical protein
MYGLLRTSFFVPTVSCTNCSIRPKNNEQKKEIYLEICDRGCLDFCAKSVRTVRNHTNCTDPYSMASHSRKIFQPKTHQKKKSQDSCPPSLENMPSLLLTFLSQACLENLSNSPPDVLSTIVVKVGDFSRLIVKVGDFFPCRLFPGKKSRLLLI